MNPRMIDWLTTAFSCYHESKRLKQCFFRFLRDLNYLQKLIKLFVCNLNHVETSKHCLYICLGGDPGSWD